MNRFSLLLFAFTACSPSTEQDEQLDLREVVDFAPSNADLKPAPPRCSYTRKDYHIQGRECPLPYTPNSGSGTLADPFCSLPRALLRIQNDSCYRDTSYTLIVHPAANPWYDRLGPLRLKPFPKYSEDWRSDEFYFDDRISLVIKTFLDNQSPRPLVGGGPGHAVEIQGPHAVALQGVAVGFTSRGGDGVHCEGRRYSDSDRVDLGGVYLKNVEVSWTEGTGVFAEYCHVSLRDSTVTFAADRAVVLWDYRTTYELIGSKFNRNRSVFGPILSLYSTGDGTFYNNEVVDNENNNAAITCGWRERTIIRSLVRHPLPYDGECLVIDPR